jgi:hypothetical protein
MTDWRESFAVVEKGGGFYLEVVEGEGERD